LQAGQARATNDPEFIGAKFIGLEYIGPEYIGIACLCDV
jgi:hypothetical protein